jgi:hypothetical protein
MIESGATTIYAVNGAAIAIIMGVNTVIKLIMYCSGNITEGG